MTIEFKTATKQDVSLIIGLAGASGSGKTYSALRLASGLSNGKPFAVIDTECGRAKHYADLFKFDQGELNPPFTPQSYLDAITAADNAGYPVIVIDSMSHEWMGDGGVTDWREEILDKRVDEAVKKWNSDPSKVRDSYAFASWAEPKRAHKKMVQKMLRTRAHLILCFRAEEKLKLETEDKDGRKKMAIINSGWQPICEKNMPYELTLSVLVTPDAPGKPTFLKLQEQHKAIMSSSKIIDENMGNKLLEWSAGTVGKQQDAPVINITGEPASFRDAAKAIYHKARGAGQRNDKSVLDIIAKEWYQLCYNATESQKDFIAPPEIVDRLHEVLNLRKPLSIKRGAIDYGGEDIVFLDQLVGLNLEQAVNG